MIYWLIFLLFGLYQGDHAAYGIDQQHYLSFKTEENDLANADEQFEEGESKDAATEAVLSSRDMRELDANHDGMLDANEVWYHHAFLLRPSTLHACLLHPATLHAFLLRPSTIRLLLLRRSRLQSAMT